jgi:hypothetical protein
MKIHSVVPELLHADGQIADRHDGAKRYLSLQVLQKDKIKPGF